MKLILNTGAKSGSELARIISLINQAGIPNIAETRLTKDGFESTVGIHHIASLTI